MESMRDRFATVATRLLREHEHLAIVLADIGVSQFEGLGPEERVFNVGIREQLMVGFAAGLAIEGLRPIVHSYAPFLIERPFEQIKLDFGHQDVGGIFVSIGGSFDAAGEGRTHQAPGDVTLISTLPGWDVHVPGHPDEVEEVLVTEAMATGRVYVRLSGDSNRDPHPGGPAVIRSGAGITVVAVGPMLDPVLDSVEGLDATVVYTTTVKPFPGGLVAESMRNADIVVVEPYLEGTSAAAIGRSIDRPHRLLSIGVPNEEHRHYGTAADHIRAHGLDATGIRSRIADFAR